MNNSDKSIIKIILSMSVLMSIIFNSNYNFFKFIKIYPVEAVDSYEEKSVGNYVSNYSDDEISEDYKFNINNPHQITDDFIINKSLVKTFEIEGISLHFNNESGDLIAIDDGVTRLNMEAGLVDVGLGYEIEGSYLRNSISYFDFDYLPSHEIPFIDYNILSNSKAENIKFIEDGNVISVLSEIGAITLETKYKVFEYGTEIYAKVRNSSYESVRINGMAFILRNIMVDEYTTFSFPGNLPHNEFEMKDLPYASSYSTQFTGPLTHVKSGDLGFNFIFVNEDEKWSTSVIKGVADLPQSLSIVNLTAVQSYLNPGQELICKSLYIQMPGNEYPFKSVVDFYNSKGWKSPEDGVKDGAIYSGHPAGTSDGFFGGSGREFSDRSNITLDDFENELPKIKELGFDNFWLLPVYQHPEYSGSIYMPYNLEEIDSRYGGNNALIAFGKAAKEIGINLMADYVPHGLPPMIKGDRNPRVDDILSDWISLDRYDDYRMEWNCYSFDYANLDYLKYVKNLVTDQIVKFGYNGARITNAMGSLPNWDPYGDNRPSNSNTRGGYLMIKAIREGFIEAETTPLIMPENYHPIPFYAPVTDFFYDLPFYNLTLALRELQLSEEEFASEIASWLDKQYRTKPEGQIFVKFLGNHDTVADWYSNYDNSRPIEVYGIEKVHALWVLLATIDGVPMIYQGDETGNEEFFTSLMEMRQKYLGTSFETEYYLEDSNGIIMFRRFKDDIQRIVLVNLQNRTNSRDLEYIKIGEDNFNKSEYKIVFGKGNINDKSISLPKYGYVVLEKISDSRIDEPDFNEKTEMINTTIIYWILGISGFVIMVFITLLLNKSERKK